MEQEYPYLRIGTVYYKAVQKPLASGSCLVRKVTKTKGGSLRHGAVELIYLAHDNIKQKWTMRLSNWAMTAQKLAIWCPGRMILNLM